jgi:hypothetical protein
MCTAAPRTGRNHDTLLPAAGAFAAALVLAGMTAALHSQPAAAQAAVPCTAIVDDGERLACYDRALRTAPAAQVPAAPAAQAPAAPAASAASTPTAAPTTATASAPASTPAVDDAVTAIVIVGVRAQPGRETSFTAQDGVTWVQTDSQRVVGLPEPPFEAELRPGVMGSRFLVPPGRGRAIRVRAVEP